MFAIPAIAEVKIETDTQTFTKPAPYSTDWIFEIALAKFNPNAGRLLSVEISLWASATTTISVTNTGVADKEGRVDSNGSIRTELTLTLTPTGFFPGIGDEYEGPVLSFLIPSTARSYTLDSLQTVDLGPYSRSSSDSFLYEDADMLNKFIGSGNLNFILETLTGTAITNYGGNTTSSQTTTANSEVTVTYTYEAVPEPGTWAAMAMGAGVLIAAPDSAVGPNRFV